MRVGIFAKTFAAQGALPVLKAAADAGYGAVQYNFACMGLPSMPDVISDLTIDEVVVARAASGVEISAISGTYNMIHPDPALRASGMKRLGVMIEAAARMKIKMVTLCTGTRDADDQWRFHSDNHSVVAWRDLCIEMEKAAALAEQFGVDLGIEPELANVVSSANLAQKLMNDVPSQRLRIVLDTANLFEVENAERRKAIVADATALLGGRISMAHAKDRDAGGVFVAAGTGVIDFAHFVECLRDVKFDGPMVTHGLSESEAPMVAKFLHSVFTT